MKVDYIIVGLGIAGVTFSKQLLDNKKRFIVIADGSAGATQASGGVFNPIVLRRFTAPEDTMEFIEYAKLTYNQIQDFTADTWKFSEENVCRIFASVEEQNNWFAAADKPHLKPFLAPKVQHNDNPFILASFGLGKVMQSFKIDPAAFIHTYQAYLLSKEKLLVESFDYSKIERQDGEYAFRYKNIETKRILFAEGAQVRNNPFITTPIIQPNKGEYLIIKASDLKLNYMLKGSVYVIPLGNDLYKVGATYSRDDISENITDTARTQIEAKLQKMITCNYEVVKQVTGVRPTTKDHAPVLGEIKNGMYVFNGLGSRGFTRGPLYSKILFDAIEWNGSIPSTMAIQRFNS